MNRSLLLAALSLASTLAIACSAPVGDDAPASAESGRDPEEPFAPHQFDAVVLLVLALEAVGLDAPAPRLRAAMVRVSGGRSGHGPAELDRLLRAVARGEDAGYEGASGDVRVLPSGRVRGAFDVWRVRGGRIARLGPAP